MQAIQKYTPFVLSAILMGVVLYLIYPHYQYYIDPDGTAYLTISKRYATGDLKNAVNGYWSPWSCWLTSFAIRAGMQPIPASVFINAIGATGFLYISQSFFLKFNIISKLQWLLNITLALFLCYAIFWQSFDDLWECFFLLSTLRIMISNRFSQEPAYWAAIGLLGALAYFAKSYSFPFFILNTLCCTYFVDKKLWARISLVAITIMILCSLPWICILHYKYGIWTTSTAGTLNTSWYLVGHPQWKEGIKNLIPPTYPDSPYYWEDPWLANGPTPHFWSSWHLFGLQFVRIGINIGKLLLSMLQLTVFFPFIIFLITRFIGNRKTRLPDPAFIMALSAFLFPVGYLLVNFESRYIWYLVPISMVAGALFVQDNMMDRGRKKALNFIPIIFALSFLIYPVWGMVKMYDEGKAEYVWAAELKKHHINGSFTSIGTPGIAMQQILRLAYFSGNSLYQVPDPTISPEALIEEMKRYKVKYYIVCGTPSDGATAIKEPVDEQHKPSPLIYTDHNRDLMVFLVNP